jgi:hypothetical protein
MTTDLDRLDALIAEQEKSVRAAFVLFVRSVGRDGPALDAILERLEARDPEGAMKIVESYIVTFGNVLPVVSNAVGAATATELAALVPDLAMSISFDPTHSRAAEIIRANRLSFVTDFTNDQRRATLGALERAYRQGLGTAETARAFRDSIGLNPSQEAAVNNYRFQLESRSRRALDYALRDRRSDRTVERAIERGRPLPPATIDRMVDGYRRRTIALRAETIARTEGIRATSQAREEALDQMIEQSGIRVEQVTRIWTSTRDARVRDWHATMNGQRRSRTEPFKDGHGHLLMYPGDPRAPAETTINCRCALTFSIAPSV